MAHTVTTRARPALCLAAVLLCGVWMAPVVRPVGALHGSQSLRPQAVAAIRQSHAGGGSPALLRRVPVRGGIALVVDERTGHVFVACGACLRSGAGTVSMLDARTGAVLRTATVGPMPFALAVDALRSRVFVTTTQGVSELDAQTGQVVRTLTLARGADWALVAQKAGHLFVVTRGVYSNPSVTLRMVDIRTGRVLRSRSFGPEAMVSAVDDHTGRVFVSSATTGTVATLDAASGATVQTVHVGGYPADATVATQAGHVFVIDSTGDTVSMLDARTGRVLRTIHGGSNFGPIGMDTATGRVFVGAQHAVDVLDAGTGTLLHSTSIETPSLYTPPTSLPLALPAQGAVAVVLQTPTSDQDQSILGPGQLLILDGQTGAIRRRVDVGLEQSFGVYDIIGVDSRTQRLFVLNEQGVEVFDTTRL